MATFNKFNAWAETMVEGTNLGSDQFAIALTNTAPVATNSVIADITQISYTNLSSRNVTTTSSSQTSGTYTLVLQDLVMTASGSVGPFRYVVLFDDTLAGDPLVGWWDYGSSITMANGETFTVDFTGAAITLS
ncbi:MAG: hypothetical protein ACK52I_12840 [Pseudomonadota bacterium]|jgi:hypothetical protein